jgi:hypothetical protein
MTEVRGQKTDDKRQMAEFRGQKPEDRSQRTENRRQRLECIADSSKQAAIG